MKNDEASRLQTILECSRIGTWEWNVQTGETVFNEDWARIVGYTLDELNPVSIKTWEKLAHPDDFAESARLLERHFAGELPYYDFESRMKHKDGRWVWVHDRGKVVDRADDGKPLRMLGSHDEITARKTMELSLQESLALFSNIFDSSPIGIAIVEPESQRFLRVNQGFADIVGYTREELLDKTVADITYPDDWKTEKMMIRDRLAGSDANYAYEKKYITKAGGAAYVLVRGDLFRDAAGTQLAIANVIDITEKKYAEQSLRESENILNIAGRMAKIGGWELYPETNEVTWTKETYRIHELPESVKPPLEDAINFWHPDDRPVLRKAIQQALENGTPYDLEMRFITAKGRHLYARTKCIPVLRNGKVVKLQGFFQDITESKTAHLALEAETEQLAVTLKSIGDCVITTDTDGAIVLMNRAAENITGWSVAEAQGRPLEEIFNIINEITRKPCENPVTRVLNSGSVIELANHTALITRDNREVIIADSAAPIKNNQDEILGVVLVFRDMTEKQRLLEMTQNAQKLESLGVLAGGIAHDFNNLLGGIYGYIELAAGKADKNGTALNYLSKAMGTIERTRNLTRQLLTFAKGGVPIQKVEKLSPFIQETAQFALSGSTLACRFDIPDETRACNIDRNQIAQVIDNIVINAKQAMPQGGTLSIRARNITFAENEHPALSEGPYVRISIEDSGTGIPRDMLSRIFDPFFSTKSKGHGIGLAICYSIISQHGGYIDVSSDFGKGSVFHIYLPATEEAHPPADTETEAAHRGHGTFLVMDDEAVLRDILSAILESLGYTVECRDNGRDALDYLAAASAAGTPVSGMIFDLTVPGGMGGKDAVAEVRKTDRNTPVFVASGYADDPVMKNPAAYGFTASICKPFKNSELVAMLSAHMKAE